MYVALYRKYRPNFFEDVTSQNHITTTLKNEVKLKKIAHAYIFTGPKGTGKTTCARIFSKALNCKDQKDGEPCGKCEICRKISEGSAIDITELDGASNNSINNIRDLKDEAIFVPTYCKYRIYIIDEAHMLSQSAFNALLKIMEEPPEYVIFILATTEIDKIPQTVVSRCQTFNFKKIKIDDMIERLKKISKNEEIKISNEAILKIAKSSNGSMRDAISLLDKSSICFDETEIENLDELLGNINKNYILDLSNSITKRDKSAIIKLINKLYTDGKDLEKVFSSLVDFYHEMLFVSMFKEEAKSILESYEYCDDLLELNCQNLNYETINLILEKLMTGYEKMKYSSNKKLFLELSLLKISQEVFPLKKKKIKKRKCKVMKIFLKMKKSF